MTRYLHLYLRTVLPILLLLGFVVDVGYASTVVQPSPNGLIRGYYQRVRRDYGLGEVRYVNCDVFVITSGDGFIVDPLVELVKIGNTVNELDGQGRLVLNLDLRGVPADLRRRLTQSTPAKPVELIVQRLVDLYSLGGDATDCESFVDLVAIDGKGLPGAPQGGSTAGALGSVPDATFAPAPTALSQPSMAGIATAQAATWFFSPHPSGQLQAVRSMNASMQTFKGGLIIYLDDVKQSFVLFNDKTWANVGAGLDATAVKYSPRLGSAVNARSDFQSCGGHVVNGDQVTAYIKDGTGRVLAWTILISSYTPMNWRVVKGAKVFKC